MEAKLSVRAVTFDSGIECNVSDEDIFETSTRDKWLISDRKIRKGCLSKSDIDEWMNWLDSNPPDFWIEVTYKEPKSEKYSNRIVQHYLNGLCRDSSFKRHITAISFGDYQPERKEKSFHHHIAVWFERRACRELNYEYALTSIVERWAVVNKSGKAKPLGRIRAGKYIKELNGFAYGAANHRYMKVFHACYGARRCKRGCKHKNNF